MCGVYSIELTTGVTDVGYTSDELSEGGTSDGHDPEALLAIAARLESVIAMISILHNFVASIHTMDDSQAMMKEFFHQNLPSARRLLPHIQSLYTILDRDGGRQFGAVFRSKLEQSQRHFDKYLAEAMPFLAPIQRIPPEIISAIVYHALDHQTSKGPVGVSLDTSVGPWKYTQICSSWRDAVVSLPELWSHWRFDYTTKSSENMCLLDEEPMKVLCKRSQNKPLSIIVDDQYLDFSSPSMAVILRKCHRWQKVHFLIRSPESLDYLEDVHGHISNLESLHLCIEIERDYSQPDEDEVNSLELYAFFRAPKLRTFILALAAGSFRDVFIDVPWDQITRFEEPQINVEAMAPRTHILWELADSRVTDCVLAQSELGFSSAPIPVPCLRVLDTYNDHPLSELTLPALETLTLGMFSITWSDSLNPMLIRSQCTLHSLTILDVPDMGENGDDSLVGTMRLVPTLIHLELARTVYDEPLLSALAGDKDFLPNLQRLTLNVDTVEVFRMLRSTAAMALKAQYIEQLILRMVENRMISTHRKTRINFLRLGLDFHNQFFEHEVSSHFIGRVDEWKDRGLDIAWRVGSSYDMARTAKIIPLGTVWYKELEDRNMALNQERWDRLLRENKEKGEGPEGAEVSESTK